MMEPCEIREYIKNTYQVFPNWSYTDADIQYIIDELSSENSVYALTYENVIIFLLQSLFFQLEHELDEDVKLLPTKSYKGNCTKEFAEKLADIYLDCEYAKICSIEFPPLYEHQIRDERIYNEINSLINKQRDVKSPSYTIRRFHTSMIYASTGESLSPYDGWQLLKNNKNEFRKFYLNRIRCSDWFTYHKDALIRGEVPDFIYGIGLSTSRKFPLVSYFKPDLAKYLIVKYLDEFDTIFDPFSGYSGRMLGTLSLNKNYIGQDLCELSINESQQIYDYIQGILFNNFLEVPQVKLTCTDSIQESGEYGCLFTCSPYGNIENWKGVPSLGYSCEKWIDICLDRYKCKKYLFVTDELKPDSRYYKYVVEELVNTSHFGSNKEHVVLIAGNCL